MMMSVLPSTSDLPLPQEQQQDIHHSFVCSFVSSHLEMMPGKGGREVHNIIKDMAKPAPPFSVDKQYIITKRYSTIKATAPPATNTSR